MMIPTTTTLLTEKNQDKQELLTSCKLSRITSGHRKTEGRKGEKKEQEKDEKLQFPRRNSEENWPWVPCRASWWSAPAHGTSTHRCRRRTLVSLLVELQHEDRWNMQYWYQTIFPFVNLSYFHSWKSPPIPFEKKEETKKKMKLY